MERNPGCLTGGVDVGLLRLWLTSGRLQRFASDRQTIIVDADTFLAFALTSIVADLELAKFGVVKMFEVDVSIGRFPEVFGLCPVEQARLPNRRRHVGPFGNVIRSDIERSDTFGIQ